MIAPASLSALSVPATTAPRAPDAAAPVRQAQAQSAPVQLPLQQNAAPPSGRPLPRGSLLDLSV
jgi:hypothetical protein